MQLWDRTDRIGPRLGQVIGDNATDIVPTQTYIVEIEVWHPGTRTQARALLDELHTVVETYETARHWHDTFLGTTLVLAKASLAGSTLDIVLNLDSVAMVDLPPTPTFQRSEAYHTTVDDFAQSPRPTAASPRLCILDSGVVTNHPLLARHIGDAQAILTQQETAMDRNGHGTMVAGLAVFGDVRACYDTQTFHAPLLLYSARVLNDANRFDDERLIINQLRTAITTFRDDPYHCRVFNLSLGSFAAAITDQTRHQNYMAEALDILARELQVVLVVAAGNHGEAVTNDAETAEQILKDYPQFLQHPAARLNDFAMATIPLTVGALAQHAAPAVGRQMAANDLRCPVATADEPAPMTRVGPGIQDTVKPDLVHYGGSPIFENHPARIRSDPGTAIMSFSHQPTDTLFAYDTGTSLAAPRVARLVALLEQQLQGILPDGPHPNLLRALLVAAATVPAAARTRLAPVDPQLVAHVCGYGLPDEDFVLSSWSRQVNLMHQDTLQPGDFHVMRIPVPDAFRFARGERRRTVTLAYDPPVNRRRLDYLGVGMETVLFRGTTVAAVVAAYREHTTDVDTTPALAQRYRLPMESESGSKRSTVQQRTFVRKQADQQTHQGNEYILVVRATRKWNTRRPADDPPQHYAVVVTLAANDPNLYGQVRQQLQQRIRLQT
ncbi:MAG: S8 family peptidase [Blastochloris sp.]|nr:S8 family peptidase [Blastochloris sp.]